MYHGTPIPIHSTIGEDCSMNYLYKDYMTIFTHTTKYLSLYCDIIDRAFSRDSVEDIYYEKHHIIPKSIQPELGNKKWNIVALTAKEHLICHHLLWRHCRITKTHDDKMRNAYIAMIHFEPISGKRVRISVNKSALLREEHSIYLRQHSFFSTNNPMYTMSPSQKEKWKQSIQDGLKDYRESDTFIINRVKQSNMMKMNNPMFNMTAEQHEKRSKKLSESLKITFKDRDINDNNNPNAKIIHVYDSNGDIQMVFEGTFIKYLKDSKQCMPTNQMYESLIYNKPMFSTKRGINLAYSKGYEKYIGWCVKYA